MTYRQSLTQTEIESLDDHQYSLFLAYGDTFRDQETGKTGGGSLELWEREVTRFLAETSREELRISQRVWNRKYFSSLT